MAMAKGKEHRVLVRPGIGISNLKSLGASGLEAPGLPLKSLVRLESPEFK